MMEKILRLLFDYQKYEDDPGLSSVINDTHSRFDKKKFKVVPLADDSLSMISAAGDLTPDPQTDVPGQQTKQGEFLGSSTDNNGNN